MDGSVECRRAGARERLLAISQELLKLGEHNRRLQRDARHLVMFLRRWAGLILREREQGEDIVFMFERLTLVIARVLGETVANACCLYLDQRVEALGGCALLMLPREIVEHVQKALNDSGFGVRPCARFPASLLHRGGVSGEAEAEAREARIDDRPVHELLPRDRASMLCYKVVACVRTGAEPAYYSIFNGTTHYELGIALHQQARPAHGGGFYCYHTRAQACKASFPDSSDMSRKRRALIMVEAAEPYCQYMGGKMACSVIVPVEVVCEDLPSSPISGLSRGHGWR